MISNPALQPYEQITSLLGEADNASIGSIECCLPEEPLKGYANEPVEVTIDPPPALGTEYKKAKADALLRPTSRVLRIRVLDGGEGYTVAPRVALLSTSGNRPKRECEAVATLDRDGHVDSIIVLDPGYGYTWSGKNEPAAPKVFISSPSTLLLGSSSGVSTTSTTPRKATAVAELEYEVYGVNVTEPGNGYVITQPPRVSISPPGSETDWSIISSPESSIPNVKVSKMITTLSTSSGFEGIDSTVLDEIQNNPTALLPSSIRPASRYSQFESANSELKQKQPFYYIPGLPGPSPDAQALPSPLYAAFDPIFGAVGVAPVTKGAVSLSADQYTRLAASGAICTVIVRSVLNPLELIKTKVQLENDEELISYARGISATPIIPANFTPGKSSEDLAIPKKNHGQLESDIEVVTFPPATSNDDLGKFMPENDVKSKLGTFTVGKSLVELRGPISLFQSADITFLVSLVFGGLGFGATELFRRAFTSFFFENGPSAIESQLILLFAAALATIITSLAATPFELIRVRSMSLTVSKSWKEVLSDLLVRFILAEWHLRFPFVFALSILTNQ